MINAHKLRCTLISPSKPTFFTLIGRTLTYLHLRSKRLRCFSKYVVEILSLNLVRSLVYVKDLVPKFLRPWLVCKFASAGCNFECIRETSQHFSIRGHEHLSCDKNLHVFKYLKDFEFRGSLPHENCFFYFERCRHYLPIEINRIPLY